MPIMNFMTRYFHNYTPHLRSFSEYISKTFLAAFFAGILFFASACEEAPSFIGSKLLPNSDFVTINSALLGTRSYTMYTDSIESENPSVSYLGKIYDPYFGSTTAEFVSQIRLGSEWKKGDYKIDSMKLFLELLSVSGDTVDDHYLRLSEIADQIYDTLPYYSGLPVALAGYTVPDILLPPLQENVVNDIVLDVDTAFGRYLIRNPEMLFHRNDTADFRSYFKGLYFQMVSPDDPIMVSLSVAATTSGSYYNFFVLYLTDEFGTSSQFTFRLDALTSNAAFNLYKHNWDTAQAGKKLEHINDEVYLDTLSYAQIFNGVYTKLILTDLDSIKNDPEMKNISVNKARLKIPVVYDNDIYKRTTIPGTLYLRYETTTGGKYLVPETGTAFYDGSPDTTAISPMDDIYNLNIASFVQKYLEDKTNKILPVLDLFILPSSANNVILRANDNNKPIKFEFTYTKF
jgi:hypothetical protein